MEATLGITIQRKKKGSVGTMTTIKERINVTA